MGPSPSVYLSWFLDIIQTIPFHFSKRRKGKSHTTTTTKDLMTNIITEVWGTHFVKHIMTPKKCHFLRKSHTITQSLCHARLSNSSLIVHSLYLQFKEGKWVRKEENGKNEDEIVSFSFSPFFFDSIEWRKEVHTSVPPRWFLSLTCGVCYALILMKRIIRGRVRWNGSGWREITKEDVEILFV